MIKIITDSTSYIPPHLVRELGISVVSLGVLVNQQNIREVDVPLDDFYAHLDQLSEIPSSSQPSPLEMSTCFEQLIQEGHCVIGIFLSSEMSGTYNNALATKAALLEEYPAASIEIIDSQTNCMQLGFMVLAAAKAANEDASLEEVLHVIHEVRTHSRFLFTPSTLTYLKKGGRIGGASALVGNLLQIKPILTVSNGKTEIFSKVRTRKKAIETLLNGLKDDLKDRELGDIMVHHIHCPEEGLALAKILEAELHRPVSIQAIGPVIGVHVGPGSIGIAYYTK